MAKFPLSINGMPIVGNQDVRREDEAIPREVLEAEPSDICCAATTRLFLSAASRGVVGDDGVERGDGGGGDVVGRR